MQQVHRKREVWAIERTVDGDFGQTTLRVELAFDNRKGQFRITQQITTEQVSRNPSVNDAMLTQLNAMNREAMAKGLELLDDWNEANPDDDGDQLELPFNSPKSTRASDYATDGPAFSGQPASNATEVGLPSEDGETVDTEEYLAQMRKAQKAERDKRYRDKKNAAKAGTLITDDENE